MALPRERKSCTLCLSHSLTREQVGMHLDQSSADGCYDEERAGSDWSRDAGLASQRVSPLRPRGFIPVLDWSVTLVL